MEHERYMEWISAALDGELTAEDRAALDAHLAVCPRCARLYERLSRQSAALRELDCAPPEDLARRVLDHLPVQGAPAKKRKLLHWKRWASLAACLVLVFTGGFALSRRGASNVSQSAAYRSVDPTTETALPDGESDAADAFPEETTLAEDHNYAADDRQGKYFEPEHYAFSNEQRVRVCWGHTPAAPSARILNSAGQLADFLAQFPEDDLSALAAPYDDAYFQTGRLLAVVVEANSGSIRYQLDPQGLTSDQVTVLCQTPEVGTDDMAAWLLLAEVDLLFDGYDTLNVAFD